MVIWKLIEAVNGNMPMLEGATGFLFHPRTFMLVVLSQPILDYITKPGLEMYKQVGGVFSKWNIVMFGVTPGVPRSYLCGVCNCQDYKAKGRCKCVLGIHMLFENSWQNAHQWRPQLENDLIEKKNLSGHFPWSMIPNTIRMDNFLVNDKNSRPDLSGALSTVHRFITKKTPGHVPLGAILAADVEPNDFLDGEDEFVRYTSNAERDVAYWLSGLGDERHRLLPTTETVESVLTGQELVKELKALLALNPRYVPEIWMKRLRR
jgi:hypothetical protein